VQTFRRLRWRSRYLCKDARLEHGLCFLPRGEGDTGALYCAAQLGSISGDLKPGPGTGRGPDRGACLHLVSPEGCSINIQEGIVRARYRESLSSPAPITPEEVYEHRITLSTRAYVFKAAARVQVQVLRSDFPQWDMNLHTAGLLGVEGATRARVATQVFLHDADHRSRITLPVDSG
jgi:hypothetical protein